MMVPQDSLGRMDEYRKIKKNREVVSDDPDE